MKSIIIILLLATGLYACVKENEQEATILVDLDIVNTQTTAVQLPDTAIVTSVRCMGNNLCYSFDSFSVTAGANNVYEIKAKGRFPNPAKGEVVCAEAIYYIDTTLRVNVINKGRYTLKFYNGATLFKTDTVTVQ